MTSITRTKTKEKSSQEDMATDVQSYLISNYREALKKGDKSAAKSCLLAARYFSVNDPNVTNEIYIMAKSDGDVSEASKCFANIFNDLFLTPHNNEDDPKDQTVELMTVMNQMREETRILLGELKSHFLKLKSLPAPAGLGSRQNTSLNPSPMLSPRMRMSSEDGFASRESISKLDITSLHSSSKSLFYQQLFENLPEETKKNILNHSIETCDNPFEQCRLIMLSLSIFSDSITLYGTKLLKTLIDLSNPKGETKSDHKQQLSTIMSHHAKSLLVLDAIPLVLNITSLANLDIDVDELFERTLDFYSKHCLEMSSTEYEINELHERVKRTITARILGTEQNSSAEESTFEYNVIFTLNLLSQRFLETLNNDDLKQKLDALRKLVADRKNLSDRFEQLQEIIDGLKLQDDLPDDILFAKVDSSGQPAVTTPPKSRGRPKKHVQPSVIVSLDDEVRKNLLTKAREARYVFFSIVQHMFVNCTSYLKSTRSRILVNIENPLATQIETELASKSSSQRTSRSRAGLQQQAGENPAKKLKTEKQSNDRLGRGCLLNAESPLNSDQSKMLDANILASLSEAYKCTEYLNSDHKTFTKLWQKFSTSNDLTQLQWYQQFSIDSLLLSENFSKAEETLENSFKRRNEDEDDDDTDVKMDQSTGTTTLTVMTSKSIGVTDLRKLVQLISCHLQQTNKIETYEKIDELMNKMKHCGMFTSNNEQYHKGNSIEEYLVALKAPSERDSLGFLFFDTLSMLRYCTDILMTILGKYTSQASAVNDSAIGHSIVLSQLDWPRECLVYDQCIAWIRANKPKSTTPQILSAATKFTYPEFFHYIRNPNIVEDFMALLCRGFTLDIKGNSTSPYQTNLNSSQSSTSSRNTSSNSTGVATTTRSGKAITTRGVNKSFKEDLKVAMTLQMRSSSVIVSLDMISEFIQNALLPYLRCEV